MCKNDIIKTINGMGFYGCYETIFDSSDDFIDDERKLKDELIGKYNLNKNDIEINYQYEDFKQYKFDVGKNYMDLFVEEFIDELPSEILNDDDFKFEIVDDSYLVTSPKYYNYSTDKCYCDIVTNNYSLQKIKDYGLKLKGSKEFIEKRWKSYEGCHYFIKNNFEYWENLEIKDYDELYLSALIELILYLSDKNIFENINYGVSENVSKYEYAFPTITYKDKEYDSIVEFGKIFEK